MRCPHQSCREMHQSRMLCIQWKKVFDQLSGTNLVLPCSTASMAGLASGSIFTNHCVDSIGSTTVSQRWQWPTAWTCGFEPRSRPSSSSRALTALRAAKRSSPANGPPSALTTPASSKIEIIGRSWRWPVSKSLGSCAGVTLTAPVPNFGSTRIASAMIGNSRFTNGWRMRLADLRLVARIVRVHGHRGVAQHRLGARRRDHDLARAVGERIGELVQLALRPLVEVDLQIGQRGPARRAPVDEPLGAVDEPVLVQAHERLDRPPPSRAGPS